VEYSETSQVLTLFSRLHGPSQVIAKGAHRRTRAGASKFDGGVDLLDLGDAVFIHDAQRDLGTLTEWSLRNGHRNLRKSLRGMYLGLYAAELIGMLIEAHDPHPDLFDQFERCLSEIETRRVEEAFLAFELDLLRESGYLPEFTACVECGKDMSERQPCYFSASRGGTICRNCEGATPDRIPFDPRLARLIQSILRIPKNDGVPRLPMLTRHQTDPINRVIVEHLQQTLGRRLRLTGYVIPSRS
jgi:DNA repair protein RecO (recombination protein O)